MVLRSTMSPTRTFRAWLTRLLFCLLVVCSSARGHAENATSTKPSLEANAASKPSEGKCTCDGCSPQGRVAAGHPFAIDIDNAINTASGSIELRNTLDHQFSGVICADDFVVPRKDDAGKETSKTLAAQVTFGNTTLGEHKRCFPLTIPCGGTLSLPFNVQGLWELGEAKAALLLDGKDLPVDVPRDEEEKVASLRVRRTQLPLNIKVADSGLATSPLEIVKGAPWSLLLQNDDALTYSVRWRLFLNGRQVAPAKAEKASTVQLAPGSNPLPIDLPDDLFPNWFFGSFRSTTLELRLVIDYVNATDGPTVGPPRTFPVFVSLKPMPPTSIELLTSFVCFVLLTIGGCASLVLNQGIPNAFQRLDIRRRLDPLAGVVKRLSTNVDGTLRVELRVQRAQLSRRTKKEPWAFPTATEVYDEIARDADILSRRILSVAALDQRLQRIVSMGSDGPPELLVEQEKRLLAALRVLKGRNPTAAEFSTIDALVDDVDAQLTLIESNDPNLRETLVKKAKKLWQHFTLAWGATPPDASWATMLRTRMGPFYNHAKRCFGDANTGSIDDESLATIDTAVAKLELILQYIRVCASATPEKELRFDQTSEIDNASARAASRPQGAPAPTQRERFFEALSGTGARSLEEARMLLREADQGIFVLHLVEQIRLRKCTVRAQPRSIGTYDPVQFGFVFYEDKFNDAVARAKLDCLWQFEGLEGNRREDGWNPVQFFSEPGEKKISVRILNGPDSCVQDWSDDGTTAFNLQLQVSATKDRATNQRIALEGLQLALALTVTLAALLSGAHEQLRKLDPFAAMAAIVALGFGADTVKNLVSRRPPAPATQSKPA